MKPNFIPLVHILLAGVAIWSGIAPHDRFTWYLETVPGFIGWPILFYYSRKTRISTVLQLIFAFHACVLFVGGHYTYELVPGFKFDIPFLGGVRNHFDKLGHFMQGITPALITCEVVRRKNVVATNGWAMFFSVTTALAFSACYELVEWWVSAMTGDDADAFLGTQGYIWDTQSDMMMALCGAIGAVIVEASIRRNRAYRSS